MQQTTKSHVPAPQPCPELKKLAVFLGHWKFQGEYKPISSLPAGKITGEYSAEMILKGFFMEIRWIRNSPTGVSRPIEIWGYDAATKNFTVTRYGDDGSTETGTVTGGDTTWTLAGKLVSGAKQLFFRGNLTFAKDYRNSTYKSEASSDGKTWVPGFEASFTKMK